MTNETGRYPDVCMDDLKKVDGQIRPSVANSGKSNVHSAVSRRTEAKCLIAFPNDR